MKLTLHFNGPGSDELLFYLHRDGALEEQGSILPEKLASLIEGTEIESCVIAVPGQQVCCLKVELPPGTQHHLDQAIPYLVEEQLASPLESVHLAHSPPDATGHCFILAVDRAAMKHWHEFAIQIGIPSVQLVPDYFLLPVGTRFVFYSQSGKILVRRSDGTGYCIAATQSDTPIDFQTSEQLSNSQYERQLAEPDSPSLVNLLQGEFAIDNEKHRHWIKPLGWSTAASIVLLTGYLLAAGLLFQHKAELLNEEAHSLYQSLFPNDSRIVNIRRQMQGHLNYAEQGAQDNKFLTLLSGLSDAVANTESPDIHTRHLQYSHKEGTLSVELQAGDLAAAHDLKDQLSRHRLAASILSVNQQDGSVVARYEVALP